MLKRRKQGVERVGKKGAVMIWMQTWNEVSLSRVVPSRSTTRHPGVRDIFPGPLSPRPTGDGYRSGMTS